MSQYICMCGETRSNDEPEPCKGCPTCGTILNQSRKLYKNPEPHRSLDPATVVAGKAYIVCAWCQERVETTVIEPESEPEPAPAAAAPKQPTKRKKRGPYKKRVEQKVVEPAAPAGDITRRLLFETARWNHSARHDKGPFRVCYLPMCIDVAKHLGIFDVNGEIDPDLRFGGKEEWEIILECMGLSAEAYNAAYQRENNHE